MDNIPTISYQLIACDETEQLRVLLYYLRPFLGQDDDIVITIDKIHHGNSILDLQKEFSSNKIKFYEYTQDSVEPVDKIVLFSRSQCKNDIIFGLCPDELPMPTLLQEIKKSFINHPDCDAFAIPRINIYSDVTQQKVNHMYVGERGQNYIMDSINQNTIHWINWPDYQVRITKNMPYIHYGPYTHSGLIGYKKLQFFLTSPEYACLHVKTIEKQSKLNQMYDNIGLG